VRGSAAVAADLIVASATGVDVHIRIAGPGARSLAYVTDWLIRVVLALAWYGAAAMLYNGAPSLARHPEDARWLVAVVAPAAAIYLLYHWVLEPVMRGSTPGKRLSGVRICARDGSVPAAGPLLVRNIFRLIDALPIAYGVGLLAVMLTPERVRVGDLAAGTLLVYEAVAPHPPQVASGIASRTRAEAVGELLERWRELDPASRRRLAQAILGGRGSSGAATLSAADGDDGELRARLERLLPSPSR
jgi:uncharacterized RDD family membrane protein YckC